MWNALLIGRILMLVGSGIAAVMSLIAMRFTRAQIIFWAEAMLSMVFGCQAFTVLVALCLNSPALPALYPFIVFNGAVHMAIAVVSVCVAWSYRE